MDITKQVKLNLQNPGNPAIVHAKQGDKDSRILEITLYDGATAYEIPAGATVQIEGTKPDKTSFMYGGTIADGVVSITLAPQVLAVAGVIPADIVLYSGTQRLSSFRINIVVQEKSFDDEVTPSEDYIEPFSELVDELMRVKGAPLVANTVTGMTDTERVYVYTGSETGYVNGNWYYYDGSSWQSGGVYNSQAIGLAYQQEVAQMVKQSAVASESDSVPYLYRPTPNPSAILADEEIVGGTVAWNQLITPATGTVNNVSVTVSNGKYTFSGTASGSAGRTIHLSSTNLKGIAGHKILMYTTFPLNVFNGIYLTSTGGSSTYMIFGGQDSTGRLIKEVPSTAEYYLGVNTMKGREYNDTGYINVMDLTAKLGSQIADYLYTLESGTAGAGVAKLKEWGFLSKDYFVYDAGTLKSVNTEGKEVVGANECYYEPGTAYNIYNGGHLIPVKAGEKIYVYGEWTYTSSASMWGGIFATPTETNKNNKLVQLSNFTAGSVKTYDITTDGYFGVAFNAEVNTYNITKMMISRINTTYQPYRSTTYPTTPTDLNGIFKLDANNQLYADGDRYKADGTITRRYGIVDMGSLTWDYHSNGYLHTTVTGKALGNFNLLCARYITTTATTTGDMLDKEIKGNADSNANAIYVKDSAYTDGAIFKAAMNGVYLVYELATPTTDTADPYPATQIAPKGGTEEWIDQRSVPVPVGHRTQYYIGVPDTPAANGTYHLTATVASGKTSMGWSS